MSDTASLIYTITIEEPLTTFTCKSDQTLLAAMERAGHRLVHIGCRRGGCGVCKVQIVSGDTHRLAMSRAHVSVEEEKNGFALACCIEPRSDLTLKLLEKG